MCCIRILCAIGIVIFVVVVTGTEIRIELVYS